MSAKEEPILIAFNSLCASSSGHQGAPVVSPCARRYYMSGPWIPPKSAQRIVFSSNFILVNLLVMFYDAPCCSG